MKSESVVPLWWLLSGERLAVALRLLRLSPAVGVGHRLLAGTASTSIPPSRAFLGDTSPA